MWKGGTGKLCQMHYNKIMKQKRNFERGFGKNAEKKHSLLLP